MSTDASFTFPAPIGGVLLNSDLGPCLLFFFLYAALVGVAIWRIYKPESRNVTAIMAIFLVSERTIVWIMRTAISQTLSLQTNRHFITYFQIVFNAGYTAVLGKVIFLLRSIVVNTTQGTELGAPAGTTLEDVPSEPAEIEAGNGTPRSEGAFDSESKLPAPEMIETVVEDQPRTRLWYRRTFGALSLVAIVPFIPAGIMGNWYPDAEHDAQKAKIVATLRLATSAMCLGLIICTQLLAVWTLVMARNIQRRPIVFLLIIANMMMIIPIYQLVITRDQTTSLTSTAPGSQNTPGEKALFYVLQVAPEYVCLASLLSVNMKSMFGTGMWGDRLKDPKPKSSS